MRHSLLQQLALAVDGPEDVLRHLDQCVEPPAADFLEEHRQWALVARHLVVLPGVAAGGPKASGFVVGKHLHEPEEGGGHGEPQVQRNDGDGANQVDHRRGVRDEQDLDEREGEEAGEEASGLEPVREAAEPIVVGPGEVVDGPHGAGEDDVEDQLRLDVRRELHVGDDVHEQHVHALDQDLPVEVVGFKTREEEAEVPADLRLHEGVLVLAQDEVDEDEEEEGPKDEAHKRQDAERKVVTDEDLQASVAEPDELLLDRAFRVGAVDGC
mmetsp:Transcript_26544/g.76704  ORF Transcript_26544/g.76704 Transcript_26544/m.76704 type:complete len:269 (+) Transcript_26544:1061-1867(+)